MSTTRAFKQQQGVCSLSGASDRSCALLCCHSLHHARALINVSSCCWLKRVISSIYKWVLGLISERRQTCFYNLKHRLWQESDVSSRDSWDLRALQSLQRCPWVWRLVLAQWLWLVGEHRPFSALTPLPSKLRALTPSPTACSTHSSILFYHAHYPTTFPLSLPTLLRLSLPTLPSPSPSSSPSPCYSGMVNDSRQVLQEPDFAQLFRDPNTPIVRKSRGTSTQGTSTHASSTHLAMLDEPPSASTSRAGSVRSARSKMSSYHGSLHRSRDGRWVSASATLCNSSVSHVWS